LRRTIKVADEPNAVRVPGSLCQALQVRNRRSVASDQQQQIWRAFMRVAERFDQVVDVFFVCGTSNKQRHRPLQRYVVAGAKAGAALGPVAHRDHHLLDDGPYTLGPDAFILAATLEWVEIPRDLVGILVGKSTLARLGLCVEDAGYIDPGFRGNVTLEMSNRASRPVVLTNGMPIAQIRFEPLMGPCLRPYGSDGLGSHYQDSHGVVPARIGAGS
jgi:deoxycytidine triphosphate deaminase